MSTMTIDQMMTSNPVPARPQVRLTRRGRLVVFLGTLMLVLLLGIVCGTGSSVATERPGTPEPTRVVQVGPGDVGPGGQDRPRPGRWPPSGSGRRPGRTPGRPGAPAASRRSAAPG